MKYAFYRIPNRRKAIHIRVIPMLIDVVLCALIIALFGTVGSSDLGLIYGKELFFRVVCIIVAMVVCVCLKKTV